MDQRYFLGFLLVASMFMSACSGKLEMVNATSQRWMGGAAGSGGGITYSVLFSKSRNSVVNIDKCWYGDREKGWDMKFRLMKDTTVHSGTIEGSTVAKNIESFVVRFAETLPGSPNPRTGVTPGPEAVPFDPVPSELPEEFQNGAVVWYSMNGKSSYVIVSDFTKLQPVALP